MSEFDHWMPLHVGDYLADTMHLSTLQHGVYIRLIMHYWKRRELVGDERTLAHIAGLSLKHFRRVCGPVLALFNRVEGFPPGDSQMRLTHSRLDKELAHAREVSEARKAAGMQGASARWGMANAINGKWQRHDFANGTRARATPTATTTESPPTPRKRGARGRGNRNGMVDIILEDMEAEREAAKNARRRGATVVSISGDPFGGLDDP